MKIASIVATAIVFLSLPSVLDAAEQTQTITLVPGWNAVWLEVQPEDASGRPASPETVFAAHAEVDIVSRLLPAKSPVEFVSDPTASSLGADIWLRWRRSTVIGQNTLGGMRGNSAYLIQNSSAAPINVSITGEVAFHTYDWVPDSYNFVGVPVGADGGQAPTFGEFFGASSAHPVSRIFKLSAGQWVSVRENDRIVQGAAYWVYCRGGS
ncbi:MAG: hypothetical protein ACR2RV_11370, partial [Verrucomicrobiales bacterium]